MLFDEIEKASDALWNLLLGILDKGTLTLGDNRRVDFSRAIIFMTSNLGAAEMSAILRPKLGFATAAAGLNAQAAEQMSRAGVDAARRKFTPEFMNRLDAVVAFNPLGDGELRRILDLEVDAVRLRVVQAIDGEPMSFTMSDTAKEFILAEGTDTRYGARHLRRAVERRLVAPLANLIATGQVVSGDRLMVDLDAARSRLVFLKECEEAAQVDAGNTQAATAA